MTLRWLQAIEVSLQSCLQNQVIRRASTRNSIQIDAHRRRVPALGNVPSPSARMHSHLRKLSPNA